MRSPYSSDALTENHTPPVPVDPDRASDDLAILTEGHTRYERRRQLGKGGMGVVDLCHDARIGRDVAMKVVVPESRDDADLCARFLREARVQGQLEHPSIVPVYDVGIDAHGSMYFTMKCLRGLTLSEILKGLCAGDAAIVKEYSRRRLLNAFSSLCLAVDFAHSRGVIHRDLKPSNVMLGSFGEVSLLDWGIAKILDGPVSSIDMRGAPSGVSTMSGNVLGTPGYIPPEQAWGKNEQLDARSDVYALGAILFEILALEPLHPRTGALEVLQSTARGADARPSVRAPDRDVAPELDAICVQATALRQGDRFPSARALHEALERFLDGDRNLQLRRDLAAGHAAQAEAAMEAALGGGAGAEEARQRALGEVGQALAIEPENERAIRALKRIFTEPPRRMPAEVERELLGKVGERHRLLLEDGVKSDALGFVCAMPFALWMGLRSLVPVVALAVLTAAASLLKGLAAPRVLRPEAPWVVYAAYVCNVLAVLCLSRGFGPLLFMPLVLVMFTQGFTTSPWRRYRVGVMITGCAAFVAAVGVEVLGILPRSYAFHDGVMTILPQGVNFPEVPTIAALTMTGLFLQIVPVRMMGRLQSALGDAERRASLQAWQLRQLLPHRARPAEGATPS